MIKNYKNRKFTQKYSLDGTPIFTVEMDSLNEKRVSKIIEEKWRCSLHHLGIYSLVDYWAVRNGQPVGWLELKCREYSDSESYKTELLNIRKWSILSQLNLFTPWPSIFVSAAIRKEITTIRYIAVKDIDSSSKRWKIITPKGGVVKSRNDTEPCILIPHSDMKEIVI